MCSDDVSVLLIFHFNYEKVNINIVFEAKLHLKKVGQDKSAKTLKGSWISLGK